MTDRKQEHNAAYYCEGIVKGDRAILSRAITLAESLKPEHQALSSHILELLPSPGKTSFRLGITGVPGVGKSTFIESFGQLLSKQGHRIAVLAVDPSSTRSKGSILGDKTRMEKLSVDPNVFIRPSPSGGTLGGVTRATYESMLLCEAAGYDFVMIETVGVGQSEVAVHKLCDFFLLLMLAGAGDELQGIKRGIMEMADALIITKTDGDNVQKAKSARAEYAHAMHLLQAPEGGWIPEVKTCSSITNNGMEEIIQMLERYRQQMTANGYFMAKRRQQQFELLCEAMDQQLKQRFYQEPSIQRALEQAKRADVLHPFSEAGKLVNLFLKSSGKT